MEEGLINNIKSLAIDMIQHAKSGHPGIVLGATPIISTIYQKHLHFSKENPSWINRDRFVLSSGHGSSMLYATLFLSGFDYTLEDLQSFRRIGSKTPGHPEYNVNLGIEMTTGPLGQGVASSVGMALSQKILAQKYGEDKIDYYVYVLCGDGDLMEGVSYEALSFAGTLGLDHLIILYDSNKTSLDSSTENTFDEHILQRFISFGFDVTTCEDDPISIDMAIKYAKKSKKPTLIEVKTVIGKGSVSEEKNKIHGGILCEEDYQNLKDTFKLTSPFEYDLSLREQLSFLFDQRGREKYNQHKEFYDQISPEKIEELSLSICDEEIAMRDLSGKILNELSNTYDFYSGSADLSSSCKTYLQGKGDISKRSFSGKNIFFGVREHAMASIANGMSLCNMKVFISTFLSFSDYMIPAMRLSALMNLDVTYIFTHDSILIGEDGATHQPIEQLPHLRNIPNMKLYRPCNGEELKKSYLDILKNKQPSILVISKEKVISSSGNEVLSGYSYGKNKASDIVLFSSGSEVKIALEVAHFLEIEYNHSVRVVSIPCLQEFLMLSEEQQQTLLPKEKTFGIELSSAIDLEKFVLSPDRLFRLTTFGMSGKKEEILEYFSFTKEKISEKIISLLGVKK